MERRDFDYYEARARYVKLEDITSDEDNAEILRRLRDHSLDMLTIAGYYVHGHFVVCEGDDFGWLGYFIGKSKCLEDLRIYSLGEGEGGENIEALIEGINRNRSINRLHIGTDLGGVSFRNLTPFFRNNNDRLAQLDLSFEVG